MEIKWKGRYSALVDAVTKFSNNYAVNWQKELYSIGGISISTAEMQIIDVILENETQQMNMTDICRSIDMPKSTFSRHISLLEKKGLVEKQHPASNKKDIFILTTSRGREIYDEYSQYIYSRVFSGVFEALDGIPEQYLGIFTDVMKLWTEQAVRDVK